MIELIVRANIVVTDEPLGDDRMVFTGTPEQIALDVRGTREIGAAELMFDPTFDPAVGTIDDFVARMELVSTLAGAAPA